MKYVKQLWSNNRLDAPYGPINATRLQHIDDGLDAIAGDTLPFPEQTIVIFGDSVTAQNTDGSDGVAQFGSRSATGYWTWAQLFLGHRFVLLNNGGVGGNTTALMLARIQTDALAYAPGFFVVSTGGDNDVTTNVPAATTIANIQSIVTQMLATGATVILTTCLPTTSASTTQQRANLLAVNNWMRSYAYNTRGVLLVDFFSIMADPTSTSPVANVTSDGVIHPSMLGAYRLGRALANALQWFAPAQAPLPFSNLEGGSLTNLAGAQAGSPVLPNPRLTGNTAGVATSVTISANSGAPTLTKSKVARTDLPQAEWQQVAASGGTDFFFVQQQATVNVGASTTATGVNALNSATVNVGSTTGFTAPGVFMLGGTPVPYTGITGTSFTGCGNHAATVGGEAITAPHSVGDRVYAVCEVEIDPGATMVAVNGERPVGLGIINQDAAGIPNIWDNFLPSSAGQYTGATVADIPSGRLVLRTPNYLLPAGSSRLFVRAAFYLNGTVRVGRMQIYKSTSTTLYG